MEDLPLSQNASLIGEQASSKPNLFSEGDEILNFNQGTFKITVIPVIKVPVGIEKENKCFSEEQLNSLWSEGRFEVDSGIEGYPFVWEANSIKLVSKRKMTDTFRNELLASVESLSSISTLFRNENTVGSVVYGTRSLFYPIEVIIAATILPYTDIDDSAPLESIAFQRYLHKRFKLLCSVNMDHLFERENINILVEIIEKLETHLEENNPEQEIRLKYLNKAKIQEELIKYSIEFIFSEIDKLQNRQLKARFKQYVRLTQEYFSYFQEVEHSILERYKYLSTQIRAKYPILGKSKEKKRRFLKKEIEKYKLTLLESLRNTYSSSKMIKNHLDYRWFPEKAIEDARENTYNDKRRRREETAEIPIYALNGELRGFEPREERQILHSEGEGSFSTLLNELRDYYYSALIPNLSGTNVISRILLWLIKDSLMNILLFPLVLVGKLGFSFGTACFSVLKYIFLFILKAFYFSLVKYSSKLPKTQSNLFKLVSGPGIDTKLENKISVKEALVMVKANLVRLSIKHQKHCCGSVFSKAINARFTKTELITLFCAVEELLEETKPEFVLKEFNSRYFKLTVPLLVKDSLGSLSLIPVENKHKLTEIMLKGNIDEHIEELKSKIPSLTAILEGKDVKSSYWEEYFTTSPSIQNWITKDNLFSTDNPFYIPYDKPFKPYKCSYLVCSLI